MKTTRLIHLPLIRTFINHLVYYPTPANLNYFWSFGSLTAIFLFVQVLSGIFLAMHYTPHIDFAFSSVEHIIRDVQYGWLLRYIHANGASFIFIFLYLHVFKNIYYKSYYNPRHLTWFSGLVLLLLAIATAFIGYVLPWGQISFWGATVITNLFTAIPIVGTTIAQWLWGGFAIGNSTLNRFFSLHYLLPFLILALTLIHLIFLHLKGSNNPLGIDNPTDNIYFYPYFYLKDLFACLAAFTLFFFIVAFKPNLLGHPDNYIIANALVTPTHIVPEWYFLPFYAILRAIPNKLGGLLFIAGALIILVHLVILLRTILLDNIIRLPSTQYIFQFFFGTLVATVILLTYLGSQPIEYPFTDLSYFFTLYYFIAFGFLIVLLIKFEQFLIYFFYKKPTHDKKKISPTV